MPDNNDIFRKVKEIPFLNIQKEFYGEQPRGGKIICPFHNDRRPSLHLYSNGFKCFACGEAGDGITFVSKLYNTPPILAAELIATRFGIVIKKVSPSAKKRRAKFTAQEQKEKALEKKAFNEWRMERYRTLRPIINLTRKVIESEGLDGVEGPLISLAQRLSLLEYIAEQLASSAESAQLILNDPVLKELAT